ncbi:unnamed protein product [Prorocentrum cordatum]|uniref:Mei2-like C-terminal RNA recognition motif domain-containing protein n=1 Tax=Prorocentrum cordatum TaxID=2364126 RepID=A0ABN9WTU1_9DINO|nr:unnamed protein product [Polarella glacialis]
MPRRAGTTAAAPKVPRGPREHAPPAARSRRPPAPGAAGRAKLPGPADLGGRLVIRNTFIEYQELEQGDMSQQLLRASSSAPALLPPPAGRLEVPSGVAGAEWRTSVLFRNVPYAITQDMFVELLASKGFGGKIDLVYLPMDFKKSQTLGYAFANAISSEVAVRLFDVFEGFQAWPKKKGVKACNVCWSSRQGFETNFRAYCNSTVMKTNVPESWKPALFRQGIRVPFPAPTSRVKKEWLK